MWKNLCALGLGLVIVAASGRQAKADTLYDGEGTAGVTGGQSGNNPFSEGIFVAEQFALVGESTITGITFNAYTALDTVPITDVYFGFYANNAGAIGTELASGDTTVSSSSITGSVGSYTLRDFNAGISGVGLSAGTYFLGLKLAPSQYDMHWTITSGYSTPRATPAYIDFDGTGNAAAYTSYNFDHAFRLTGNSGIASPDNSAVPLPSTAWAGLGLLGCVGAYNLRRRFAKA